MSQHIGKGYLSKATSKGSGEPAHKRSLARGLAARRHVVETLRKLQAKTKRMAIAQIGDCACAFEEPQTGKPHDPSFRMPAQICLSD